MSLKYAKGKFKPKNPEKYVGKGDPTYRSSWEWHFMQFCDTHPSIKKWASETIGIPYFNPLTNTKKTYVPDFFILYEDKDGNSRAEIIEIKPTKETTLEAAGRNARNQAMAVVNQAKWRAADQWCKNQGFQFRVITENEIFHNPSKKR